MSGEYKPTEVGVTRVLWDSEELGNFISLQRGHDLTWRDRREGEIPVMGSAGLNGWHNKALVKGPGVILGRSGASFGKAHYCEVDFWPHNTALYVTDFRGNDPLFVFYFLSALDFSRHNSGGAQQSLNRNFIASVPIKVPRPAEQRAIAAALSDVDAMLGGLDRLIAKKRDLKQAAMQQLLTGQTRLPGFHGEWDAVEFGDVACIRNAKVVASSTPVGTQCVELESIDHGNGRVRATTDATGVTAKYSFRTGDVLFGRLRAYLRKYWLATFDGVCSTEIWPLISRDGRLCSGFLHLLVQTNSFVNAAGVSYGTHMPRSDWSVLEKLSIILPPTTEQVAIAAVLSDMDAELAALEARREKTRALKQGMMRELLTGRTRLIPIGVAAHV
ncbi:MAG: restriction endonuclease subunit S [Acidobacteria bacterium]|nr:restriction endonuclease subunit S [Acidobacteriota bacterium]